MNAIPSKAVAAAYAPTVKCLSNGFSMEFPGYPSCGFLMPASGLLLHVYMSGKIPTTPDGWIKAFKTTAGFNLDAGGLMFSHALLGGLLVLDDKEMRVCASIHEVLSKHVTEFEHINAEHKARVASHNSGVAAKKAAKSKEIKAKA